MNNMFCSAVLLCGACISYNSHASTTAKDAMSVFRKLLQHTNVRASLIVSNNNSVNAVSNETNTVYINTGMLKFLNNRDELAMVLGHELGHISRQCKGGYDEEFKADMFGAYLAHDAGFNVCHGLNFFYRFKNTYGDETNADHPRTQYRIDRFSYCLGKK